MTSTPVGNLDPNPNIEVFPNPTSSQITIRSKQMAIDLENIQVMDVLGRIIINVRLDQNISNETTLNLQELKAGTYWIRMNQYAVPFVKQ